MQKGAFACMHARLGLLSCPPEPLLGCSRLCEVRGSQAGYTYDPAGEGVCNVLSARACVCACVFRPVSQLMMLPGGSSLHVLCMLHVCVCCDAAQEVHAYLHAPAAAQT